MLIRVEARESFDVEPGRYRAKCIDVRDKDISTRKGTVKGQRIVWEIDVPGNCADISRRDQARGGAPALAVGWFVATC